MIGYFTQSEYEFFKLLITSINISFLSIDSTGFWFPLLISNNFLDS